EAGPHRLRPVAAPLGDEAVEEGLHLLHVEGEIGPLDHEVLALTGPGWSLAFVAIAVRDRAHARRRHQALESRGQAVHAALRHVLEGEDLPPPRLAEARGPARSDPEAGPHAEAEAAPGAEHVEEDEQAEDAVRHRRDPDAGRQTPRARTRAGVVYHRSRARNARAWTRLSATSLRAWSRMTSR